MRIYLEKTDKEKMEKVRNFVESEILYNPNLSGEKVTIEESFYTFIDSTNAACYNILHKINKILGE